MCIPILDLADWESQAFVWRSLAWQWKTLGGEHVLARGHEVRGVGVGKPKPLLKTLALNSFYTLFASFLDRLQAHIGAPPFAEGAT